MQNSDAADRFGVTGVEPSELYYYFREENLEDVEAELKVIKQQLGPYKTKMDEFFKSRSVYTDMTLANYIGLPEDKARKLLRDYADYHLGMKIRDCIKEQGSCEFTAEY